MVDFVIKEYGLYRSRAEFFIDAGRERYRKIIKTLYRQKRLLRKKPKGLRIPINSLD